MLQYVHAATNDLEIQNLDHAVSKVFDSLMPNPLLNSPNLITGVVFASGGTDVVVNHKLGRVPKGYILVGSTASANLYTSPTTNKNTIQNIILRTSAATTVSILFF